MNSYAPLVDDLRDELDQIESIFGSYRGHRSVHGYMYDYVPADDGCVVSLWDAWSRFLRRLVVVSLAGPIQGLSGATYSSPQFFSESQALTHLSVNRRGNNFQITQGEPKWFDPACLASIVNFFGLPNAPVIIGAVGSSSIYLQPITVPNPLEQIRRCRNYVAHKMPRTWATVQAFGAQPPAGFSSYLRQRRSGVETFSEWHDCLVAISEAACQ